MASDRSPVSSELSRELGLFQITMMGLGMMIGAGLFIGIGKSIHEAGSGGLLLTFALNGVIAIMTAMGYAELSSAIPRAGGAYNFARLAFGRGTSFTAGWMEWFASSVAGSMYAVVFSIYAIEYLGGLGWIGWLPGERVVQERILAALVASLFLYVNYRGASETGRIGALFTIGQTLFVVLIGIVGLVTVARDPARLENFKPFMPNGWWKILATMGFTFVAFEGYEVIAQAGDETIEPRKNLPKAMLYSVGIVTVTYVLVAFATVVCVRAGTEIVENGKVVAVVDEPWRWIGSFGATGFAAAVGQLMRRAGPFLVTLAVIFASTSALNATIFSATRTAYALGRDRMLPGAFARISQKRKTPWVALLATAAIVLLVATALPVMDVASSASIMFIFLFLLVNLCVIRIRRNMGDELAYGYVMPLFPLPPLLAVLCLGLLALHLFELSWLAWVTAPAWIVAGLVVYRLYSRSHAVATEDEIAILEEERAPEDRGAGYRITVAVANPANALDLVRNTYRLARSKDARVELLHMVPVPPLAPLADAERYMLEGKEGVVEAMLYLAPMFPLSTTLRYCRNPARGIVSAVRERRADLLILGWHGAVRGGVFQLGSTVDPVIERAPCDVVVMKDCGGDRSFRRVLVPLAGGPNGALALEIASILAEGEASEIVAFTVNTGRARFDVDAFVRENEGRLAGGAGRVSTAAVRARDVVGSILREAESYDLVVLGSTRVPVLRRLSSPPVPETVARTCAKPLVMVKAAGGLTGWLSRWI